MSRPNLALTLAGLALLAAPLLSSAPLEAQLAVRGGTVHPVSGPAIQDGVVLIGADGRIEAVGPASQVAIPAGMRVLEAAVVTPGLVDPRSVVGLAGILNQPHDQDQLERSEVMQPELRAFDAYNAREELVGYVRRLGVTTLHTGHGPGALMSGQTMVVKTRGMNVEEALVDSVTTVAMTLGPEVSQNFNSRPGSRARGVALVRGEFLKAEAYRARRAGGGSGAPARDLRMEILSRVLDGEVQVLLTAHQVSEIQAALRLQREFGFRLILDGGAESYLLTEELKDAGVPVFLHATLARHSGSMENATFETARLLADAGVEFAIQTGFEPYVPKSRVLLFEAALAVAYGLPFEAALRAVTLTPARILGLEGRIGSLEVGKDADLVLFDGDPFEYLTRVCAVLIEGQVTSEECF
jgi:imidazolonepropionase-like amidohydrolase